MTESVKPAGEANSPMLEIVGNAAAPFVYFDLAAAHSVEPGGVVIIEVVARTVVALAGGGTRNEIVATAHLRTTLQGANSLQSALNSISLMLTPPPDGPKN